VKLQTLQAELSRLERRRATLQKRIQVRSEKVFRELPRRVGLKNIDELLVQLLPYASKEVRANMNGGTTRVLRALVSPPVPSKPSRGTRYSADVKATVKRALEMGGRATDIAVQHGLSLATVKAWKKVWGLRRRDGRIKKTAAGHVHSKGQHHSAELKAAVRRDIEAGAMTAKEIAAKHHILVTTLKGWKRDWRLTRKYKKKAGKARAK
jgi:transposase-like protein